MRGKHHGLAVVVIAALAPAAVAQPRIGVLARAGADPPVSPSELSLAVEAVVGDSATVFTEPRFQDDAVPRERLAPFRRARQLADEGWRAYHEVEPAFAESRLVQARQRALEVIDLQGGFELLAEISRRLGAVRLYRGRPAEAVEDFRLASNLAPERPVSRAEFRPSVVELYAEASRQTRLEVRLDIDAPTGAGVEIDGVSAGAGAVSARVFVGHHTVVVRQRGYRPSGQIVAVTETGDRIAITLEPDELAAALALPFEIGTDETGAALRVEAATVYGELDAYVLLAPVWRRRAPALLGQRCEGVPARCTEVVEIGFADASGLRSAAAQLWSMLSERRSARRFPPTLLVDARLTHGEKRPGVDGNGNGAAWWKSGWLWIGVGTAALAATTYALLSQDESVDTIITVRPCDLGGACTE